MKRFTEMIVFYELSRGFNIDVFIFLFVYFFNVLLAATDLTNAKT